jgi:hypothetical protein
MRYTSVLILFTILLQACTPQFKLAKKYISSPQKETIVIIPPTFLFKNNIHPQDTLDLVGLDTLARDSIIYQRSTYLRWIEDSTFLQSFNDSFLEEIGKYGLKVYLWESSDTNEFIKWKVDFVQAQLEEDQALLKPEEYLSYFGLTNDDVRPKQNLERFLNSITFNIWLKVFLRVGIEEDSTTLFHTNTEIDPIASGFTPRSYAGKPVLIPNKKLSLEDIYKMAQEEGKIQAVLLFDMILNTNVYHHLSNKADFFDYLHYDRATNIILPAGDNRFEVIP